jgi:CubicO group peptidase (beta-lactamase class C family)
MLTNKRLSNWFSLGLLVFSVSYFGSGNGVYADTPSLDSVFVQPSSSSDDLAKFIRRPRETMALVGGTPVFEQIDACMTTKMEQAHIPGAALALVVDGKLVYERGYGVKHREQGGAVDANTRFRFGSIQKMMTAAAVMTQVEHGAVALHEPLTKLIPELQFAGQWRAENMTVAHLLTHTAAVPNLGAEQCGTTEGTLSEWAASLKDVYLYAPPGSFYNYSNAGYALAGLVAERASGLPYHRLMRERIWEPAGMTATTLLPKEVIDSGNYTYGHEMDPETGKATIYAPDGYDCWWSAPAGFGFSTAGDLARWAILMMTGGGGVLAPSSVEAMQARQVSMQEIPGQDYGYGIIAAPHNIFAAPYQNLEIRVHGGGIRGWSSSLLWVPEQQFAVAVLANGGGNVELGDAASCALDVILQPEWQEPPDYSTDPATWQRYRGLYLIRDVEGKLWPAYVAHVDNQLLVARLNPDDFTIEVFPVKQLFLDTFFVDLDRNGEFSNPLEVITFIKKSLGSGPRTMWVRNREYVGHRVFKGPALTAAVAWPDFVFQDEFWMREIQRQRGNSESR